MWDKGARRGARWTGYVGVHFRVHIYMAPFCASAAARWTYARDRRTRRCARALIRVCKFMRFRQGAAVARARAKVFASMYVCMYVSTSLIVVRPTQYTRAAVSFAPQALGRSNVPQKY